MPWDLDAVIPEMLTEDEKRYLNQYHAQVRETISPYLDADEQEWLAQATRSI